MPDLRATEALGNRDLKNVDRSHTAQRITAIAAVVAARLAGAGILTGSANAAEGGLTSVVAVSVHGTTDRWAPGGTSAAASATTAEPTTTPAPTPEPQVPTASSAPESSPATSAKVDSSPS